MRRALLGAGLAMLVAPGVAAETHSLAWICAAGALAGILAAELDHGPRDKP